MSTRSISLFTGSVLLGLACPLTAAVFQLPGGASVDAAIATVVDEMVFFEGKTTPPSVNLADLDATGRQEVESWKKANPEMVGVYTKVDAPPNPSRTVVPELPQHLKGKEGMVAVTVIIDERGNVVDAKIRKSSQDDLNQPTLEAVRKWVFVPAKVAGNPVKVRIVVPFKF